MTKKELLKTARLARLSLSEKEELEFTEQLKVVFEYFNQIASIPTTHVKPLVHPLEGLELAPPSETLLLREDRVQQPEDGFQEDLLALAPDRLGNEYKTPRVME